MNHRKMLSAVILLVLTKSALGIEFEPNNDSSHANKLGTENVGKLNRASDVDFFSIDSCVKNDKKVCTDKHREEVSLLFTCNNRSATSTGGWFLGIHDSNGELQETYPVKPDDCVITDTRLEAFSFKFPINPDSPNYYISVVADCQAPIYNTTFNSEDNAIINVNRFVATALTTKEEIKSLKDDLVRVKEVIVNVKKDLSKNAVINSNANVQQLSDAFALVNSIASIASEKLTPETNITAAVSAANAIEIAGFAMRVSIVTWSKFKDAEKAERNSFRQIKDNELAAKSAETKLTEKTKALDDANTKLAEAKTALTDAKKILDEANATLKKVNGAATATSVQKDDAARALNNATDTVSTATSAITVAENDIIPAKNAKAAAQEAKDTADQLKLETDQFTENTKNAKADDDDAKVKLADALTAVDTAVKFLSKTVQDNINAANTAQNLGKQFDLACKDNYNVGVYTIKDNVDSGTTKPETNLGLQQSGQIKSITNNNVYVVESDGTSEVPLVFICSAMAARQTNDWNLSIYNDKNALVSSMPINGSSCGSTFVSDKGGYNFKLPKGSPRYYLSVESACVSSTKKDCVVETAEYSILRDVDKVYSGKLASKRIDANSADLKLTNCGLNNSAVISIKAENVDLAATSKLAKLPINIQIGGTACRIFTPDLSTKNMIVGSVVDSSEIIDSISTAQDSAQITIGCGSDTAKITLTGSKLDLENLNPNPVTTAINTATVATTAAAPSNDSVVIPVKVDIGDFHCETKEAFYSSLDILGMGVSYSNISPKEAYQPPSITPYAKISAEKFSELSVANRIEAWDKVDFYKLAVPTKDTPLQFSCTNSKAIGSENGWVVTVWEHSEKSEDWLQAAYPISSADCGIDGGFKFTVPMTKEIQNSFVGVQSSCVPPPENAQQAFEQSTIKDGCKTNTSNYTLANAVIIDKSKPIICFNPDCTTAPKASGFK